MESAGRRSTPQGVSSNASGGDQQGPLIARRASGRKGGKVSTLTIGRLAAIHDQGEGHNPRRQIIAQPDQQTIAGMARDAQAMLAVLEGRWA